MAYSEASKRAAIKYTREKVQRLEIRFKQTEYDANIAPAIEKSGLPVATYIKSAIYEKIERDSKSSSK